MTSHPPPHVLPSSSPCPPTLLPMSSLPSWCSDCCLFECNRHQGQSTTTYSSCSSYVPCLLLMSALIHLIAPMLRVSCCFSCSSYSSNSPCPPIVLLKLPMSSHRTPQTPHALHRSSLLSTILKMGRRCYQTWARGVGGTGASRGDWCYQTSQGGPGGREWSGPAECGMCSRVSLYSLWRKGVEWACRVGCKQGKAHATV